MRQSEDYDPERLRVQLSADGSKQSYTFKLADIRLKDNSCDWKTLEAGL